MDYVLDSFFPLPPSKYASLLSPKAEHCTMAEQARVATQAATSGVVLSPSPAPSAWLGRWEALPTTIHRGPHVGPFPVQPRWRWLNFILQGSQMGSSSAESSS